jgi:hypothetical protein
MKSWAPLTKLRGTEYQQVSSGESHGGNTGGKFVPGAPSGEYRTNTSGESHSAVKHGKFCGPTKGNSDLPPDHTKNTPQGSYSGK